MKLLLTITATFICLSSLAQTEVIFRDDFNDNLKGWYISEAIDYSSVIRTGHYHLHLGMEEGNWQLYEYVFMDPYRDFSIEIKVKQMGGDEKSPFGIVWGLRDQNMGNAFEIQSKGSFRIYSMTPQKLSHFHEWDKVKNTINPIGEYNSLKIQKKDSVYYFYINDIEVAAEKYINFKGSNTGIIIRNNITVQVDYIEVRQDGMQLQLIDNPNNGYQKINLGKEVNSPYSDVFPVISPDGKTLFVARYHPQNTGGVDRSDIWMNTRDSLGNWNEAEQLGPPLNNMESNAVISVASDGNSMLMMNLYTADGKPDGAGVSMTYRKLNGWTVPAEIIIEDFYNNHGYSSYWLSADKQYLLMAIQRDDSYGGQDIYVSFRQDNSYSLPLNLGNKVNTFAEDITPFLAPDNTTLYYSTNGKTGYGSSDIFVTKRLDDSWTNWSEPKNLGPEINTYNWDAYYTLPASGEIAYMVSYENTYGEADIFKIEVPESARPDPVVLIYGQVLNATTKEPLSAEINYYDLSINQSISNAISEPGTGNYKIVLPYGKLYSFLAGKENFYSVSDNIDLTEIEEYKEIKRDLYLHPLEVDETIRLNNLFFDYDKAALRPESFPELDRLVQLLEDNPQMEILIQGHTDSDGDAVYNLQLSKSRASSVLNYLLEKGIAKSRLNHTGFGETEPIANNTTPEGKTQNRRVEFVIVKK